MISRGPSKLPNLKALYSLNFDESINFHNYDVVLSSRDLNERCLLLQEVCTGT